MFKVLVFDCENFRILNAAKLTLKKEIVMVEKIENDDRNVDKYYDKMLEIKKKHDLPAEFKQELEKVKDVYEDNIEDKDRKR